MSKQNLVYTTTRKYEAKFDDALEFEVCDWQHKLDEISQYFFECIVEDVKTQIEDNLNCNEYPFTRFQNGKFNVSVSWIDKPTCTLCKDKHEFDEWIVSGNLLLEVYITIPDSDYFYENIKWEVRKNY